MSEVGPHDTNTYMSEKQAYMGDLSSMAIESNHKESNPRVCCLLPYSQKQTKKHDVARQ